MASTSPSRRRVGDEDFMVDMLAKMFGYGCMWLTLCFVAVGTACAIGTVIMVARMISE